LQERLLLTILLSLVAVGQMGLVLAQAALEGLGLQPGLLVAALLPKYNLNLRLALLTQLLSGVVAQEH
jgi:hypothetical protein